MNLTDEQRLKLIVHILERAGRKALRMKTHTHEQLTKADVDGKEIRAVEAALIAQTEQRKGAV
jgi:hypothetical protein